MSVCVMIHRKVQGKSLADKLAPLMVQLRSQAGIQPGFITDQTFSALDADGEYLVISTWNTMEDWNRWMNSEQRMVIQRRIDSLTGEKTLYRYYEPIVGGILPAFKASV